ncbi:MAG: FG-GAP-like repeat-containing protein [Terracidiphilus sp.]
MKNAIHVAALSLFLSASIACAQRTATTTTLAVTSSGNPATSVAPGTPITLTATVLAGNTAVTPGQVNFCDAAAKYCTDIHLLGMAQLIQSGPGEGTATLTFYPVAGVHSYKAVFLGTTTYAGSSSSPIPLTVIGNYPTTTTIAQSGGPGDYTLTATVTGQNDLPPSGAVSFLDTTNANYPLATAELTPETGPSGINLLNSWNLTSDTTLWKNFPTGDIRVSVVTGDFNGDGKLDMAVLWVLYVNCNANECPAESELDILLGNGDGTFTAAPPAVPLNKGIFVDTVVAGDFNGDGKQDLALQLGNPNSDITPPISFQVLLGNGDGTFTSLPSFPTPGSTYGTLLGTGDFNGDGKPDLAIALDVDLGPNSQGAINNDLYIVTYLGNGDGTFQPPWTSPLLLSDVDISISNFAIADFNGDGNLDIAMANDYDTVIVMQGNGDGTFKQLSQAPATGNGPLALAVADFNEDGIPDLATANSNDNTVTVLLGKGDGTFTAAPVSPPTGPVPVSIAVGNFSKYGTADLAVANFQNSASVLLGNGDGTFGVLPDVQAGVSPVSIDVGDFTGNGLSDWAVGEVVGNQASPADVDVLIDQFNGFMSTATVTGISPVGTGIHLVDASYAGNSVYSGSLSGTTPLEAERVATTLAVTATLTGGQLLLTATVSPSSAQGHTPTGTINFSSGNTNLGSSTISNGVATLTVSSLPPGANSVTAVYPGDTNFAGSTASAAIITADFTISAAPASQTVYTGLSASYTVTVTPSADFNLPVALSCSQLPANTTCSFSPAGVTGGSGTAILVVHTSAPSPSAATSALSLRTPFALVAGLILMFIPRRPRRRTGWPLLLMLLAALAAGAAIAGCGAPKLLSLGTPVGAQTITVNGTATNGSQTLTHATTVTLNVNSLF